MNIKVRESMELVRLAGFLQCTKWVLR